jgi:nucleoside-diphosphate kinase
MERTLILLKPDAVQRGLVGAIISRFEAKGLKIAGAKLMRITRDLAERHYAPHKGKDFYEPLLSFITSGPAVAMVLEGNDAVRVVRSMMGSTFGPEAPAGTIRGDWGMSKRYNLVHGSDSQETAEREIALFFRPEELLSYDRSADEWVYARGNTGLI